MIPNIIKYVFNKRYFVQYKIAKRKYNALKHEYEVKNQEYENARKEITLRVMSDIPFIAETKRVRYLPKSCLTEFRYRWQDTGGDTHYASDPFNENRTCEFFDENEHCEQDCNLAAANMNFCEKFQETSAVLEKLNDYWPNWKEEMKKKNRSITIKGFEANYKIKKEKYTKLKGELKILEQDLNKAKCAITKNYDYGDGLDVESVLPDKQGRYCIIAEMRDPLPACKDDAWGWTEKTYCEKGWDNRYLEFSECSCAEFLCERWKDREAYLAVRKKYNDKLDEKNKAWSNIFRIREKK